MSELPSNINLHIPELRQAVQAVQDPKRFAEAVKQFMNASYLGNVEFDRLWKLLRWKANRRMRYTVLSPGLVFDVSNLICIWSLTDYAVNITSVEVTLNTAAFEIAGDLMYADDFITRANAVVVQAFDTTSGKLSLTGLSLRIPKSKSVYLSLDSKPDASITQMAFDWRYQQLEGE